MNEEIRETDRIKPGGLGRDILCLALILLLCCVFFHRVLLAPGKMLFYPYSDFWRFLAPQVGFVVDSFYRDGALPLWEPYAYSGKPPYGVPQLGVFYPFFLVVLLSRSLGVYGILFAAHCALAGAGTYLFVREIGGGRLQGLLSACVFSFCGYLSSRLLSGQYWHLATVAWMPWVFLAAERVVRRPRSGSAAALGGALAMQFLAGHTQYFFYTMLALAPYLAFRLAAVAAAVGAREVMKRAASIAGAGALFALLVGVQLLPAMEFSLYSYRANIRSLRIASYFSLLPSHLLTFLLPDVKGSAVDFSYWGEFNYWELCGYVGLVPLALAAAAVAGCRNRYAVFFAFLLAFALLFSMGMTAPLFPFLYRRLPGVALFRCPSRMLAVASFAAAVLAGFGFTALREGEGRGRARGAIAFFMLLFALLLAGIGAFAAFKGLSLRVGKRAVDFVFNLDKGGPHTRSLAEWQALVPAHYEKIRKSLFTPRQLASLAAAAAACGLLLRRRTGETAAFSAVLAAALFDLWSLGMPMISVRGAAEVLAPGPVVRLLREDRELFRVHDPGGGAPLEETEPARIGKIKGFESVFLSYYIDYLACLEFEGKRVLGASDFDYELRSYIGLADEDYEAVAGRADNLNFLNLLNVKYVTSRERLSHPAMEHVATLTLPPSGTDPLMRGGGVVHVYRNRDRLPRAFMVSGAVVAPDPRTGLEMVKTLDPRRWAVLEVPEAPLPDAGEFREALVAEYAPNRITVEGELRRPGLMVLSEVWYPGWRAFEEGGRELPVLRADHCLRAVRLGPGAHRVVFTYRPFSFRLGRAMSCAGLVLLGLLMFNSLLRRG